MSIEQSEIRDLFMACAAAHSSHEIESILKNQKPSVQQRVRQLLGVDQGSDQFLEQPPATLLESQQAAQRLANATVGLANDPVGTSIGGYKLLQQIGEGGFGIVYMAEQTEPVRRRVALKVIKPGMDSKEVIARFEAERQALAMMDHPHVAKVLDAGTTANGRPFFVMELVHGTKITEFCDNQRLTTEQRLKLFVDVCRAVQHAHMKGIIHRDIKPSNILVAMDDDRPSPKVIDFGVSKAISQTLTDQTMFTRYGQMVGTPLYMSPEQAQFTVHDIDVRSDVYSLGVVLYELLTGNTPFDRDELMRSGFDEMQRIIREVEPPRPSARISTLRAELISTVSDKRQSDPRRLSSSLAGELDWIVMKSLEKDRSRRYESARELAADIQRYLDDEAVMARPPSAGYRLAKFTRRHRAALTTATVVLLALIAGFSAAIWQAVVATQERNRAVAAEKRAEREAEISAAVNEFLNEDLLAQADLDNQPNPNVKLRTVIDQAAEKLQTRFEDQPLVEAAIRHTLATGLISLGEYGRAQDHLNRAVKLRTEELGLKHRDTIDSEHLLIWNLKNLGKYREAYQRFKTFKPRADGAIESDDDLRFDIAWVGIDVLDSWGDLRSAETLAQQTLKDAREQLDESDDRMLRLMTAIAVHEEKAGRTTEAYRISKDVLQRAKESKGEQHPFTLVAENNVAFFLLAIGKPAEAEDLFKSVLNRRLSVLGEAHPGNIRTRIGISQCLLDKGKAEAASELAKDALEASENLLGQGHATTLLAIGLVVACDRELNQLDHAASLGREMLERCRQTLGPEHPTTISAMGNHAVTLWRQGLTGQALTLNQEAVRLAEQTLGNSHGATLIATNNLAGDLRELGRIDEAIAAYKRVLEGRREQLGDDHPSTLMSIVNLARALQAKLDYSAAEELLLEGKRLAMERYGPQSLEHADVLSALANFYNVKPDSDDDEAQSQKTIEPARQALAIYEATLGHEHRKTIEAQVILAGALKDAGDLQEAERRYVAAIESSNSTHGQSHPQTLTFRRVYAIMLRDRGDGEAAVREFRELLKLYETLPDSALLSRIHAMAELATTLYRLERYEECIPILEETLPLCLDTWGPQGLNSRFARDHLALCYLKTGQQDKAVRIRRDQFEVSLDESGIEDSTTVNYAAQVAYTLRQAKRHEDVIAFAQEWLPQFEPHFEKSEANIRSIRDSLIIAHRELARTDGWQGEHMDAWEQLVRESLAINTEGLGAEDKDTVECRGYLCDVLSRRAEQLVLAEEYAQALKVLSEIAELSPNREQSESLIGLQLFLDEQESAAAFSQTLWERAQAETGDEFQKARWVVDALLSPRHGLDADVIVEFSRPLAEAKEGHYLKLGLGLALYRRGDFKEAAETIATSDHGTPWIRPLACYFSAMAHHRMGDTERARELLGLAVERRNRMAATPTEGVELQSFEPPRWALWCIYQGIEREAYGVLEIETPKPLVESASEK